MSGGGVRLSACLLAVLLAAGCRAAGDGAGEAATAGPGGSAAGPAGGAGGGGTPANPPERLPAQPGAAPPPLEDADAASAPAGVADALAAADRLTPEAALALAALPLSCIDRPQPAPHGTGYLYEQRPLLRPDYVDTRAFYGCFDWHSAVNSTWALVAIVSRHPSLPVAPLLVEKLDEHLNPATIGGEVEFFSNAANAGFERPYGWAWLLYLQAELIASAHPRAQAWAAATEPLARLLAADLAEYFEHLRYPMRVGTHHNTAFAASLAWRYARIAGDRSLAGTIEAMARRLFAADRSCPLPYEPSAADFLSPCLEEARLMAEVLPRQDAVAWLDAFLPPAADPALAAIAEPPAIGREDAGMDVGLRGARSHLIGLMFTRAEALAAIAALLGPEQPRSAALLALAERSGRHGVKAIFEAGYLGSHWLGAFAVRYLLARDQTVPSG